MEPRPSKRRLRKRVPEELKTAEHFAHMRLVGEVQGPLQSEQIKKTIGTKRQRLLMKLQQIAENRDGKFLGLWRENKRTMGKFACAKNHNWTAIVENVKRGEWCWKCGHKVHDDEQCREIAEKRGGKCLRTWQEGGETLGEFVCSKGHPPWIAAASRVIERSWCRICAIEKTKIGIEHCRQYAKEKGGKCLSTEYINANTKLHWSCAKGHEWWARWSYVNYGYWCSKCSRERRFKKLQLNKKK